MLRKIFALTLTILLAMSVLTACGGSGSGGSPSAAPESPASTEGATAESTTAEGDASGLTNPVQLTFAAQEVGTGAYSVAAALQSVMIKGLPAGSTIDLMTNSPGGVGAPVLVNGGEECDVIVSNAGPTKWSYGLDASEYDFGGCTEIASLGGGFGHTFTIVLFTQKFVDATGYTSLEQVIADKYPIKMITKKNGSLGELTAERVIEACGITVEEFNSFASWEKTGADAIKTGLQDDLYDCTIDHIDAGQANTTELCLTHDMYFVQLEDGTLANLGDMGYAAITMEAGTWNGQDTDIQTMGSQQNVLVSKDMPDDIAYALTKAICEGRDELSAAVASLSYFDPEVAGLTQFTGCPLHPGAIAYYEEMGYPYDA